MSKTYFQTWFRDKLVANEIDQAEFARRYQRAAGLASAPTGRVSEWASGKAIPGLRSAQFIAEVFKTKPETVVSAIQGEKPARVLDSNDPAYRVAELAELLRDDGPFLRSVAKMLEDRLTQKRA